jgi:WD40 repeat protein
MQSSVTGLRALLLSSAILLMLTACAPATQQPTATAPAGIGTFEPPPRDLPTLPPPVWVPASENVTLANVTRIAYLGRLDAQGTASTVFDYAFSPDGSRLVGLNNEQVIGWSLITGKLLFNTSRSGAAQIFYGADKTEVYTVDGTGQIRIYDAENGQLQTTLQGQPVFNGYAAYDPIDGWLALGGQNGSFKVWDVKARQSLVTMDAHTRSLTGMAFSSDGTRLATISSDQTAKVWDWQAKKLVTQMTVSTFKIAFSPDGSQLAVGEDRQITIWNAQDGKMVTTLTTGPRVQSDTLIYSPDGQYIVNGGSIQTLTIWDTQTGKLVNTLPGAGGDENAAAFSYNGDLLVTSVLGGEVNLWDISSIRSATMNRATLDVGTRQILYADWTPDGFILLLAEAAGPIQVWGIAAPATPTPDPTTTPGS